MEHPIARVGTIHGIDEYEVHPNQKSPIGMRADWMQAKYSRRSGDLGRVMNRDAIFSWYMLVTVAMRTPTHIAGPISIWKKTSKARMHTSKDRAGLLGVEAMIGLKDKWNRAELEIENSPAEGGPQGEEEDHRFGQKHVYVTLEPGLLGNWGR